MKSLKEIKAKIFKTECKNLLFDGLSRSEPIMTKDEKGIIDNYFIYAANQDMTEVSKPMVIFGIYSDLEKVAYIKSDIYDPNAASIKNVFNHVFSKEEYIKEYDELYMKVRGFVKERCDANQKETLKSYVEHLFNLTGSGLWENYKMMAPIFFDWVREQGVIVK